MYTLIVVFIIGFLTPNNLDGKIVVDGFQTFEECKTFYEEIKPQLPFGIRIKSGDCNESSN